MKIFHKSPSDVFGILFTLVFLSPWAVEAQEITPIGVPGAQIVIARDINNNGEVVGGYFQGNSQNEEAFLYSNGTMTDLGNEEAFKINNSGDIIGVGSAGYFLYSGGITTFLTGFNAFGINDTGQLAGNAGDYAALYSNGTVTKIVTGNAAIANGINNSGQVVGAYNPIPGQDEAFLYSAGKLIDIGTGTAYAINDSGEVVGSAQGSDDGGSFLYSDGVRIDLGSYGGTAMDINDLGQVVGFSSGPVDGQYAYTYSSATGLQNLNSLYSSLLVSDQGSEAGFTYLLTASAINNSGEIVGQGDYWTGTGEVNEAFLLNPAAVPEPKAVLLLGLGLGVLFLCRQTS